MSLVIPMYVCGTYVCMLLVVCCNVYDVHIYIVLTYIHDTHIVYHYIHMYIPMYIHDQWYIHMYIPVVPLGMYNDLHTYVYICMYIHTYIVHVCTYICHACMYICNWIVLSIVNCTQGINPFSVQVLFFSYIFILGERKVMQKRLGNS